MGRRVKRAEEQRNNNALAYDLEVLDGRDNFGWLQRIFLDRDA